MALVARLAQWKSTSFTRKGSQVQALQRAPFYRSNDGRVAEWLKAPDSKSDVRATVPWVRIPPLPPPSCHIFARSEIAKGCVDFVFANHGLFGDCLNDSPLLLRFQFWPQPVQVLRLGDNCRRRRVPVRPRVLTIGDVTILAARTCRPGDHSMGPAS